MNAKWQQLCHTILDPDTQNILITSHAFPDGDSIASQLALRALLIQLNKTVTIYNNDPPPERYRFLPGSELIETVFPDQFEPQLLVVLDVVPWERLGRVSSLHENHYPMVIIDHHVYDEWPEGFYYIDPTKAATAEIIYDLYKELRVPITKDAAFALFTGLLTDTGRFRFSNTNSNVLRKAADLIDCGANSEWITREIYFKRPLNFFKNFAKVIETMQIIPEFRAVICHFTAAMNQGNPIRMEETEDMIELINSLKEIDLYIFLKEYKANEFKISFRSRDQVDGRQIANLLGGGGHKHASGARLSGDLAFVKQTVLDAVNRTQAISGRNSSN